jgi:hypothetical protein
MRKYIFAFPRCDAEKIIVEGDTYGEAADKAIAERIQHIAPLKADGEIYEQKPSLTNPNPLTGHQMPGGKS